MELLLLLLSTSKKLNPELPCRKTTCTSGTKFRLLYSHFTVQSAICSVICVVSSHIDKRSLAGAVTRLCIKILQIQQRTYKNMHRLELECASGSQPKHY